MTSSVLRYRQKADCLKSVIETVFTVTSNENVQKLCRCFANTMLWNGTNWGCLSSQLELNSCVIFQEMSGLYSPMMEAECTVPNVEAPSPAPRYSLLEFEQIVCVYSKKTVNTTFVLHYYCAAYSKRLLIFYPFSLWWSRCEDFISDSEIVLFLSICVFMIHGLKWDSQCQNLCLYFKFFICIFYLLYTIPINQGHTATITAKQTNKHSLDMHIHKRGEKKNWRINRNRKL